MSTRDINLLVGAVDRTAETIREYVRQIESGEYGQEWEVTDSEGNTYGTYATYEDSAYDNAVESADTGLTGNPEYWDVEHVPADEPTVDETPISEYPLEIVDRRGREFAVVLGIGGPHIEVVADGDYDARLEGYWGGSRVTRHGDYLSTFLDYFIDRDSEV